MSEWGARSMSQGLRVSVSVLPKISKPVGGKLGVTNRVLDILMAEVVLQRARVMAIIGEFESAGMPKHVRVDREWHLGGFPEPSDHSTEAHRAHGRPSLAHE